MPLEVWNHGRKLSLCWLDRLSVVNLRTPPPPVGLYEGDGSNNPADSP